MDVVHVYHRDGELFPTPAERASAFQPGKNRLLMINWKPATDSTWHQVAQGYADPRIDRLANHLNKTFRQRFFLAIWHEPENDVNQAAGSGDSAADYAAMYRHVVSRLRGDGVTYAITVMDYTGYAKWALKNWFASLWPGDSYVDWIGIDPYGSSSKTATTHDFTGLINHRDGSFPGYYTWATMRHPGKPIMLAEWGIAPAPGDPTGQARFFRSVIERLGSFPRIKAMFYFDSPTPPPGQSRVYLAQDPSALRAYRSLSRNSKIVGPQWAYPR